MDTYRTLRFLLLACMASSAMPVAALPLRGQHIIGTIQKVDTTTHQVEMLREDNGTLIKFVWNKRTTFVTDIQMADAAFLKRGAHVEVAFHEPVFGKPFVTKIALLPCAKPQTKNW